MHCNLLKLIMQVYQLKSKSVDRISHRFGKSQLSSINLYLVLYEATLSNYLFTLILFLSTNRFGYVLYVLTKYYLYFSIKVASYINLEFSL